MKQEKFSIGEKVFLVHLKQEALIVRVINNDLIYVDVDGMEIPVFTSDVSREIQKPAEIISEQKNTSVRQPKESVPEKIQRTDAGIFLSFEPIYLNEDEISSFNIFLINDTAFPIEFDYYFMTGEQIHFALKKLMVPYNYLLLHSIEYDLLNEMPSVELSVRDVMNQQFKARMVQKIKPQNFFNKLSITPVIQKETYQYKVQTQSLQPKKEGKKPAITFDPEVLMQMMMEMPVSKDMEVESPVVSIDLHLEALPRDFSGMDNSEKLHVQLQSFQQALERAISHSAKTLFVIHGVGSGKLKNEIHRMLRDYKEVRAFNNNYHPRYGYGATEIILK